jgi:predicted helicase
VDTYQGIGRYRYTEDGTRIDNITDWGLKQFQTHYAARPHPEVLGASQASKGEGGPRGKNASRPAARAPQHEGARKITKDDIFHYVYGVLHDPVYRETYAINLKREFPRIPFYPDFWQWAGWGERLMALHIGYESVEPWPLTRHDTPEAEAVPIPKLKADKDNGIIILDSRTTLSGIPPIAWTYRLGNRSGLEWVLDQYKEKKPKDPTIAAKFNTYRFKDYKEKVIDLLMRVTRVSVETMEIVEAMKTAKRE